MRTGQTESISAGKTAKKRRYVQNPKRSKYATSVRTLTLEKSAAVGASLVMLCEDDNRSIALGKRIPQRLRNRLCDVQLL